MKAQCLLIWSVRQELHNDKQRKSKNRNLKKLITLLYEGGIRPVTLAELNITSLWLWVWVILNPGF